MTRFRPRSGAQSVGSRVAARLSNHPDLEIAPLGWRVLLHIRAHGRDDQPVELSLLHGPILHSLPVEGHPVDPHRLHVFFTQVAGSLGIKGFHCSLRLERILAAASRRNFSIKRAVLNSASRPMRFLTPLERYFEFKQLDTTWKTEILAGITTFITMAYIVFVNPSILKDAGMAVPAVFAATCLAAAFASILMGVFARYPIALAPGMGLNAYFTYTVVKGMGVPWQTALGAVFLSGIAFLILTFVGIRQLIVEAIPPELYAAVAAGIG